MAAPSAADTPPGKGPATRMHYYRTSGRINPLFLLLAPLAVALAAGMAWGYVNRSTWVAQLATDKMSAGTYGWVCLAVALGHLAAVVALITIAFVLPQLAARFGRCRNRVVAVLFGLLLGTLILLGRHYVGFEAWKADLRAKAEIAAKATKPGRPPPKTETADPVLWKALLQYYKSSVDHGVLPLRTARKGEKPTAPIPPWTIFFLYAIELLLLPFGAAGGLRAVAEPYDEKAGRWLRRTRLADIPTSAEEESRIAGADSVDTLLRLAAATQEPPRYSVIYELHRAVDPTSPSYLGVSVAEWRDDTGEGSKPVGALAVHDLVTLTPEQVAALEAAVTARGQGTGRAT